MKNIVAMKNPKKNAANFEYLIIPFSAFIHAYLYF